MKLILDHTYLSGSNRDEIPAFFEGDLADNLGTILKEALATDNVEVVLTSTTEDGRSTARLMTSSGDILTIAPYWASDNLPQDGTPLAPSYLFDTPYETEIQQDTPATVSEIVADATGVIASGAAIVTGAAPVTQVSRIATLIARITANIAKLLQRQS